mgnify:CR=1 FL=1
MPLPSVASLLPCLSRLSLRTPHIGSGRGKASAHAAAVVAVEPARLVEKCVGFVAVSRFTRGDDPNGATVLYIEELYVDPDYRRMGVAHCLLKRAISTEEDAPSSVAALVVRANAEQQAEAREFYKKVGFKPRARPPTNLTEPIDKDQPEGERQRVPPFTPMSATRARIVALQHKEAGPWEDMVEQYMEASIADMRVRLADACERVYRSGLPLAKDDGVKNGRLFLSRNEDIWNKATAHHQPPKGDAFEPDPMVVWDLLTDANWGVYGAYVSVPVSE